MTYTSGQEIHFDAALAVALAGFAAAAFHIEAETAGLVAALARFGQHGVELANGRENTGVGGGIRARRAADGRLIDLHDFIDVLDAGDGAMRAGLFHRAIELRGESAVQNIVHERGFSGAGDAGDDGQQAERKSTSIFFRLWPCAPRIAMDLPLGAAAASRGRRFSLGRKDTGPVSEAGFAAISSGAPAATRYPPALPAPGPRSTT